MRRLVVSKADRAAARKLCTAARLCLTSPAGVSALERLRAFFDLEGDEKKLTVVPYALSSRCTVGFGSLTGNLITLGVHPGYRAEQVVGVLVHEVVHSYLDRVAEGLDLAEDGTWEALTEALATAIGNGWMVAVLSGSTPTHAWYDDRQIDIHARTIYPSVVDALQACTRFAEAAPSLLRLLAAADHNI
jgi:hypothetical protein